MTLSNPLRYKAAFTKELDAETHGQDLRHCRIEERDGDALIRTFIGKVDRSLSAHPDAARDIQQWCVLNPRELPEGGGIIAKTINLDAIQRHWTRLPER